MQLTWLVNEPLWISKVKAIRWPLSKVTQIQYFKTSFPKKNTGSVEAKFRIEPPWDNGMKICSNVPGHMAKVASRLIYGKNLKKKNPSSEPRSWWSWNLIYSFGYSSTTKFLQMKTLVWPCPFLRHGQICFVMLLHGWKLIQHIVIYFEGYSNSVYPMHSGERYRTVWSSGLYVFQLLRQCFNTLLKKPFTYVSRAVYRSSFPWH